MSLPFQNASPCAGGKLLLAAACSWLLSLLPSLFRIVGIVTQSDMVAALFEPPTPPKEAAP
jgi:CBS-domain-containing membrane protein